MLLVDRSGSMNEPSVCGQIVCPSKWQQLVGLGAYLAEAKQLARLGLAMFPSPGIGGCDVRTSVRVPLSDDSDVDVQIMAQVESASPGGKTPVAAALDVIAQSGGLDDPARDNILLVLTDGAPNCACGGERSCEGAQAIAAVERLVRREPPIDVDIIGFGASAQQAQDTLNQMAQAAGDERYYQSDTIEELIGTLYEVGVRSAPCKFDLDDWPEPTQLIVWIDGSEASACTDSPCTSGYSYDPSVGKVVVHGSTCEGLRDGQQHQVWFDTRQ
jgi:hypothetical protein